MQRLITALAAFLSLLAANLLPAGAQRTPGDDQRYFALRQAPTSWNCLPTVLVSTLVVRR